MFSPQQSYLVTTLSVGDRCRSPPPPQMATTRSCNSLLAANHHCRHQSSTATSTRTRTLRHLSRQPPLMPAPSTTMIATSHPIPSTDYHYF
ncbi:hypothetical protein KFK09_011132 [Dendrobium nobile]|uniref:Uncharacterized protein n=1 Tax=Dendrobium nobile TaxID=94219 RepID=A0A8T3BHG6_DENNO|nr:hypothetical protein KFK09_011132 [Dendrobium nobile]